MGGLGGSVRCSKVTRPKHRPLPAHPPEPPGGLQPPCLALRNICPTMTRPGPRPKLLPWQGLCLICSQPGPQLLLLLPPGLASLPPLPETGLFSQTSPRGLANPLDLKRKIPDPSPTPPPIVQRGFKTPGPTHGSPGPLQVATGGQSMDRWLGGRVTPRGCPEAQREP